MVWLSVLPLNSMKGIFVNRMYCNSSPSESRIYALNKYIFSMTYKPHKGHNVSQVENILRVFFQLLLGYKASAPPCECGAHCQIFSWLSLGH